LKYFIWSLNAKLQRREQLLARQVHTNFTFRRYSHTTYYAAFHHMDIRDIEFRLNCFKILPVSILVAAVAFV